MLRHLREEKRLLELTKNGLQNLMYNSTYYLSYSRILYML